NGHKWNFRKFYLNLRKKFLTVRVTGHWNMLPMETVESASLDIFKTHLDTILGNVL
ncbi:hypothetical protein N309_04030, partial [Tinamus guttatus]